MEWISVKDRMPVTKRVECVGRISDMVLLCVSGEDEITFGWWNAGKKVWRDAQDSACCGCESTFYSLESVTHWMPLPQPPKE